MLPTLREVLDLPVLRAGAPELICAGSLDRLVRWVHVSEVADLANLLEGDELVLTTGLALADAGRRDDYLPGLAAAGAAGVVIELGRHLPAVPRSVVRSWSRPARRRRTPTSTRLPATAAETVLK